METEDKQGNWLIQVYLKTAVKMMHGQFAHMCCVYDELSMIPSIIPALMDYRILCDTT